MHARAWLIVSLGLNVLLGAFLYSSYIRHKPVPAPAKPLVKKPFNPFEFYVRTNVVVRRQNFTWHEVESSDYSTYVNNLRTIGCPEQTIRDIIVADVDQLYAHRRATEVVTNDFQWWRSEPDHAELKKTADKIKALEDERRTLLTKLLGPNWERSHIAANSSHRAGINLSGPVLGDLSPEVKERVYQITGDAQKAKESYRQTQRQVGLPIDSAELAKLEQQKRAELAAVLSPDQLEEFLLRYSETAEKLRRQLKGANATADEFRTLFRALDSLEQEIAMHGREANPSIAARLNTLQARFQDTLSRTLGSTRYKMMKLNQDPLFRQTKSAADRIGVAPNILVSMYEINQATESERQRIRADASLNSTERIEALSQIQAEQQKSLEQLLGPEKFQKWFEIQERK